MPNTERKPRQRRELGTQPEFRFATKNLEVRSADESESGLVEVRGEVVVYDTPYMVYDMWGEFEETIHVGAAEALLKSSDLDVRFLFNHGAMPLARTGAGASLVLNDSTKALGVVAQIDPRMSAANDLAIALERGTVTQMSVGMVVDPAGDSWSGEDDYGMPNVRDIYRLAEIFDVSAVTYPASPTTSIDLARSAWSAVPVESRERTRKLWAIARDGRAGRDLSQADSDVLLHTLERLHAVDNLGVRDRDMPNTERSAPTPQDKNVLAALGDAHAAISAAITAQAADPDNNTDPVDKKVQKALENLNTELTALIKLQGTDGTPDAPTDPPADDDKDEKPEDKDADPAAGDDNDDSTSGTGDSDGTGEEANRARALIVDVDLDMLRRTRFRTS